MLRRRCARMQCESEWRPAPSGPRCEMTSRIRIADSTSSGPSPSTETIPAMPHTVTRLSKRNATKLLENWRSVACHPREWKRTGGKGKTPTLRSGPYKENSSCHVAVTAGMRVRRSPDGAREREDPYAADALDPTRARPSAVNAVRIDAGVCPARSRSTAGNREVAGKGPRPARADRRGRLSPSGEIHIRGAPDNERASARISHGRGGAWNLQ